MYKLETNVKMSFKVAHKIFRYKSNEGCTFLFAKNYKMLMK